jgi:uncharacterized damage-inducible protein DinB
MAWQSTSFFSEHDPEIVGPPYELQGTVEQVIAAQRQLADVIGSLSDAQYRQKPVGLVPSSVGGHVRHCLDHVQGVLTAASTGQLNYDLRERGTAVETDREAAILAIHRQEGRLAKLALQPANLPLRLTAVVSPALPPVTVATTLGRELAFVLSHTVHHSALVAVMVKILGRSVPEHFGYAPATIAHLESAACAR